MFWFKSCPKCNTGDLYAGQDRFSRYIACLQCGHYLTEAEEVVMLYLASMRAASPGCVRQQPETRVVRERSLSGVG